MESKVLVSIYVVTYNSSKTVLETLESIKSQTYERIELVVTDDHSKDNTVEVCQKWIDKNRDRFERVQLISSDVNTGVACNANRGFSNCHGVWIKGVAGDDMLLPHCIDTFIDFTEKHPDSKIIEGKSLCFGSNKEFVNKNQEFQDKLSRYFNLTHKQMYHNALRTVFLAGPPLFIKKELIDEIGGYNTKYPCCEEFTLQVDVLKRTYIYFLDEYVVHYRVEQGSLSRNSGRNKYMDDVFKYFDEERSNLMLKEHMYLSWWDEKVREIVYRNNYPWIINFIFRNSSLLYWQLRFRKWFHLN